MNGSTLEELENDHWEESDFKSHLVNTCHRLRKKPIGEFTVENLRIMLGQNIGARYLLPLALVILEKDPLVEGHYYPGDLLRSVLCMPMEVWEGNLLTRMSSILKHMDKIPEEIDGAMVSFKQKIA